MTDTVVCNKVTKIYNQGGTSISALKDIDLCIEKAELVSISGPSGSGKSTLLNMMGGLDRPTSGEVYIAGQRIDLLSNAERAHLRLHKIGFIFQAYNLIPVLTAKENVEFIMQLQQIDAVERSKRSLEILETVGLAGKENRFPGELSGGQQQRVAIARAIVSSPNIILADEPTANLDSKTAQDILEIMVKMNSERQVTFVFSTHDKLVMSYAKRLIKLHDGSIAFDEEQNR